MAIDPLGRSPSPRPDALRPEAPRSTEATTGNASGPDAVPADVLALSADALQASRQEAIPVGELTMEQLDGIRQRLASGFYDSPEVLQKISEHVAREIHLPVAWGGLG